MVTVTGMTASATQAKLDLKADLAATLLKNNNLSDVQDMGVSRENLNLSQRIYLDVRDFGAVGDGAADDTTAINNALVAASNIPEGATVYFPHGTYSVSGNLTIWSTDTHILGESTSSARIKPIAGSTFDVFGTQIPGTVGTAGFTAERISIERLMIDCSLMTSTVAGRGNAIHLYGVDKSRIRDVYIKNCPNYAILIDGDATNTSHKVDIRNNRIEGCGGGILVTFSSSARIIENNIEQANLALAANQPMFDAPDSVGYMVRLKSGYGLVEGNYFGSGGTYTSPALQTENAGPNRIIANRFDQCRYQAIKTVAANNVIANNSFSNCSSVGSVEVVRLSSTDNIVEGNQFDITNGAAHYTYCINESATLSNNLIFGNRIKAGTSGTIHLDSASTGNQVFKNLGYNPVGAITAPTVPATTVAYTNNYGSDATVYISGGTVSNISIDGLALGTGAGFFRVPSAKTIAVTYSAVPTWKWILD